VTCDVLVWLKAIRVESTAIGHDKEEIERKLNDPLDLREAGMRDLVMGRDSGLKEKVGFDESIKSRAVLGGWSQDTIRGCIGNARYIGKPRSIELFLEKNNDRIRMRNRGGFSFGQVNRESLGARITLNLQLIESRGLKRGSRNGIFIFGSLSFRSDRASRSSRRRNCRGRGC